MRLFQSLAILILFTLMACEKHQVTNKQFELLDSTATGINFTNQLAYDEKFNVYTYRNFYNGGGVAIGDINNDGLVDIYFTANMSSNKLYLNKGNFQFEDISNQAGVGGKMGWSTGVTMVDVNGDGWLDIYVCNSGGIEGDRKENELFINNMDGTFSEQGKKYRLNDPGYGTHASFFDYDKDGDLDVYLLNNSYQAIGSFNLERNERGVRDSLGGDKLLRFNGEYFEDVSEQAGIYGSIIGFGLGVTVGDLNRDGWEDIYISNDFFERDYLYYNNQDGTFREALTSSINSISGASMGADMADINNDGYSDIFVTEMLPGEYSRLKSVTTFENFDKYQYNVKNGYFHQFTRNTLQLNNENSTFSEIGRLSGVEASDWSWGALIFDMDNDGFKDLYIANGIYQDLTDQDYLNYVSNDEIAKSIITKDGIDYKKLIDIIPSNPISNKAYKNFGNLKFEDVSEVYGLDLPSFSNGAAYGDLDNDGDLDLVVNNVNMPSFIYRNNTMQMPSHPHFLRFELKGEGANTFAIGTQITLTQGDKTIYIEQQPTRGFQSSMDNRPLIGLPDSANVNLRIIWPSQKVSELTNVEIDKTLKLKEEAAKVPGKVNISTSLSQSLFKGSALKISHKENSFVDFNQDRLRYHMTSTEGPKVAVGDVNQDGVKDYYVGGSKGYAGQLIYGSNTGLFRIDSLMFINESGAEDAGSALFDADGDGDLDLYVCTGGSEFSSSSSLLKDKYYINNNGKFSLSNQSLPLSSRFVATSMVVPIDYDLDGDIDLFVSERFIPFQYGFPASGFLLQNDGSGNFSYQEQQSAAFKNIGMITDVVAVDFDDDMDDDLVIVGEYMGIRFFSNNNSKFEELKTDLSKAIGWWNTIESVDIDGDGDEDFVVGNHGLNSRFRATVDKPLFLVVDDFDKNGFSDPILSWSDGQGNLYPYALRHNLADQLKFVLKRYPDYKTFKDATLKEILGDTLFNNASKIEVNTLSSILIINEGEGRFSYHNLPMAAQLSPVFAIKTFDFDLDGDQDIILGGNLFAAKPEVGRYDASYGLYLENNGKGEFKSIVGNKGFQVDGEIRDLFVIGRKLIVARNNNTFLQFEF